jgi:hypothetical protein
MAKVSGRKYWLTTRIFMLAGRALLFGRSGLVRQTAFCIKGMPVWHNAAFRPALANVTGMVAAGS